MASGDNNAVPRAEEETMKVVQNDDDLGLVDVESMCMNCHDNVSGQIVAYSPREVVFLTSETAFPGFNQIPPDQDPLLPRCSP